VSYDAIVIGAGLNGLTAAGYLGKGGRKVLVVERRDVVGGPHVTSEFAPGFRVDNCLHDVGALSTRVVRDLGLLDRGLKLLSVGGPMLAPDGKGRVLQLSTAPERLAESIKPFSTRDAGKAVAFGMHISKLAAFLAATYDAPTPSIDVGSMSELFHALGLGMKLRKLGKQDMVAMLRTAPMSVAELLDDWFESDVLKGAIGAAGITHLCQGPRAAGTAFVLLHHVIARAPKSGYLNVIPLDGVGAVALALADAARAFGAEIRTGAAVSHISMKDGRANGVVLASGEELTARRVVSSADPGSTFLKLCDPSKLEPEFVRAVRHIRYRGVWAKVNLALDTLPVLTGVNAQEMKLARTGVTISPSLDHLERAYDDAKYGRVSARPYLDVRIPTLINDRFAPAGKHVMSVHVQYAPYHLKSGAWDAAARAAVGDRVISTLGEYFPNIASSVLHREVFTPLDLEAEFGMPEGNAYHGEMTLDQILFMRPTPACSKYSTPVRDLFLCGSGSHPGGAIAGGAGANAARAILAAGK